MMNVEVALWRAIVEAIAGAWRYEVKYERGGTPRVVTVTAPEAQQIDITIAVKRGTMS